MNTARTIAAGLVLALILAPSAALAGKKKKAQLEAELAKKQEELINQTKTKPTIMVEVDFDEDGVVDVRNYYVERNGARVLVKKETDLNLDGHTDVISEYDENAQMTRELMDGDFDGLFDWTDHYEDGKRVRAEVDTDYDGLPDVTNHYRDGRVTKKERDTDGDDVIDFWETFDADGNRVSASTDTTEQAITEDIEDILGDGETPSE